MDRNYTKDPEDVRFWREEAHEAASELIKRVEELRNQVAVTSKASGFYVYFHWRELDERAYYQLELALTGIHWFYKAWLEESTLNEYIVNLLGEEVQRNSRRFSETKFYWFFKTSIGFLVSDDWYQYNGYRVPPIREYLGNYKVNIRKLFQRIYTIRAETPRRVKQKVFRRGYDDKGSESSVSERARRDANREEFPYLTKDFLEWLRGVPDPLRVLRRMGYLLPQEE